MKKRGQAALEFLTTYGWAFLVILIMIGALAYFGVLNPKNFLPSRCTFSPEVDCVEASITSAGGANGGTVLFRYRNQIGSTADFAFNMTYIGSDNPETNCAVPSGGESLTGVPPGRVREVECVFASGVFPSQDKAKFEVDAYFKKADGEYWIPVKGEIYGTVN